MIPTTVLTVLWIWLVVLTVFTVGWTVIFEINRRRQQRMFNKEWRQLNKARNVTGRQR